MSKDRGNNRTGNARVRRQLDRSGLFPQAANAGWAGTALDKSPAGKRLPRWCDDLQLKRGYPPITVLTKAPRSLSSCEYVGVSFAAMKRKKKVSTKGLWVHDGWIYIA